ncbi:stage III sporulation protein AA [Bacillus sp. HMF5848]|uniref:stage III sporulation protein AA n=1 Tax=Bacillus sp. HMF5848 TaxID=2495421 RepID=UPI000F797E1E|nr:stage III sporulation protein AA [Bacillus sp. HMF5848]RSK27806.1 stage III sporulation protein AA [Bacillus sp. HMF5848]
MHELLTLLPSSISSSIAAKPPSLLAEIEEIRMRVERPLELVIHGEPQYLSYIVSKEDASLFLNKISQFSIYALEEELKRGYITVQGGHRIGLAGKVVTEQGVVKFIRDVTSFNIRIAKQKIGLADELIPYIYDEAWYNTIIIGPPQSGKTTMLRDIARYISSGNKDARIIAKKVGIVDERSEIAGCLKGIPQHTFGPRVDVLDACPKAEGMMMMIRSMSPDVLVVDEIGRMEDAEAILEAVNAGVSLVMTVHGTSYSDLYRRPSLQKIMEVGVFTRLVELSRRHGPGTIEKILTPEKEDIYQKAMVT